MSEFSASDSGFGRFFITGAFVLVTFSVVCVLFLGAALGLGAAAVFFTGAFAFCVAMS
jgi:hypothetical protein